MRLLRLAMRVCWFAYWAIAARGAKATQWRAPLAAEWLHYTLALLGTIVLAAPARHARDSGPALFAAEPIRQRPRRHPHWTWYPGIAIAARIILAANWSAAIEIKEDHALIRSGAYRYALPDLLRNSAHFARQRDCVRPLARAVGLRADFASR